jgi:periplasmic protein TonB
VFRKNNIPSFDDLIFESRNREYGAYQLRKKYNSFVIAGIIISTLLGCSAVIIPFALRPRSNEFFIGGGRYVQLQMDNLEPPREEFYVPAASPPPRSEAVQEIVKYVPPEVVDTIININNVPAATDEVLAQSEGEKTEAGRAGFGDELFDGAGSGSDEPFIMVEVMPSFRGGDINKFREYIQKRTNYPQEAIDKKIQGRIFLTFIIETDGSVSNVTVVKGVDPLIDNEAVKAIQGSPNWSPGLQRGQPVRVRYSMWLSFII